MIKVTLRLLKMFPLIVIMSKSRNEKVIIPRLNCPRHITIIGEGKKMAKN